MIEPDYEANEVPLRNRFHYPPQVPSALLGPGRDVELHHRDHPARRAREHEGALRSSQLAIYIDAAGNDALHAHDGAESLHRVLWDLDVAHEYRLRRDPDHIGPDLPDRLRDAFAWVGGHLAPRDEPESDLTRARAELRAYVSPLPAAAARSDPTAARRYGRLP